MRYGALGLVSGLALAACGGGGGGVRPTPAPPPPVTPTPPPPAPTPVPPLTPPPPASPNDSAEFRRSDGALLSGAIYGWDAGATGRGTIAAVIDGGIDTANPEFAGRIAAASADTTGSARPITDTGGHGTAVAGVLAAAKNDSGSVGVAYGATLLVLKSDTPGSCAGFNSCSHEDSAIARGVDTAVAQGARVINLSLGGSPAARVLVEAIDRATAAGIVVVISAGNDASANPDPFPLVANTAAARGLVVVAGAFDALGDISSYSNRAGSAATHYLLAPGNSLRSYDAAGAQVLVTGTSFAAPVVSGAIALLAQAFPNLSGTQLVQLLYDSATDLGAAGTDPVYGRGRIDLARAFRPQGTTALAGSGVVVSGVNGAMGAAMGDARGGRSAGPAVVLDKLGRAYGIDLAPTIATPAPAPRLTAALAGGGQGLAAGFGGGMVAVTVAGDVRALTLDRPQADLARARAAMMAIRIGPRSAVAMGFAQGTGALAARLGGRSADAFLIAEDPAAGPGFLAERGAAMALRHDLGPLSLTFTAERGAALAPRLDPGRRDRLGTGYAQVGVGVERRIGGVRLAAAWSRLHEADGVLGARFRPGLVGGGTTDFVDLAADHAAGSWSIAARLRHGWTRASGAIGEARLASSGFVFDLGRTGVAGRSDRLALRIAQPLRVSAGALRLTLPTSYDYVGGVTATGITAISLAPTGREIDVEAGWSAGVAGGWLTGTLFWRRDPGHFATLPDDAGAAVRFMRVF